MPSSMAQGNVDTLECRWHGQQEVDEKLLVGYARVELDDGVDVGAELVAGRPDHARGQHVQIVRASLVDFDRVRFRLADEYRRPARRSASAIPRT